MKRPVVMLLLISMMLMLAVNGTSAQASERFPMVYVDEGLIRFMTSPVIIEGRTFVPAQELMGVFGASGTYDEENGTFTCSKGDVSMTLTLNSYEVNLNDNLVEIDVPMQNIDGVLYLPLRFISESFGLKVGWNPDDNSVTIDTIGDYKSRTEILNEIAGLEAQPVINAEVISQLAALHYQAGHFEESRDYLRELKSLGTINVSNELMLAEVNYMLGNYATAEELLNEIISENTDNMQIKVAAEVKLLFVYYQTNQFTKANDVLVGLEGVINFPTWDLMKSYGETVPNRIDWNGLTSTTVPFVEFETLPVIPLVVNGKEINAIIDTGGDALYLDTTLAESLGIEKVASAVGTFAGGKEGEVGYGVLDELKFGDVTMHDVTINTLPTEHMKLGDVEIHGIVGTSILRHFLSTHDYVNEQLVLYPRTAEGKEAYEATLEGKEVVEVPFALAITHMMYALGHLNGQEMNFFIDSGLASEDSAFIIPNQTIRDIDLTVPVREAEEGSGGSGEEVYMLGVLDVSESGLGATSLENQKAMYGTLLPDSYWARGFIQDGLISQKYFAAYDSWTIDFDTMTMIFAD